jgi:hypothetical protein
MRYLTVIGLVIGAAILLVINAIFGFDFKELLIRLSGAQSPAGVPNLPVEGSLLKEWIQIGITLLLLAASLFVILSSRYGPKDKHWAYATVGTLIGFWLKV